MSNDFLSIGQAAKRLGVHIETLRRWENDGYITPHYTNRGHRRFALQDLEEFMGYPKKVQVGLFHREKNKMTVTKLIRVPQEGDLIWFNFTCYKVEKVVHFYTQNEHQADSDPNWYEPHIFLSDVSPEEAALYWVGDKHDWDRDDWIGNPSRENVEIGISQYSADVSNSEGRYELRLFVKDGLQDHFPEGSEHEVRLQTGKVIKAKTLLHYDKKEGESFTRILLEEV